jgi:hypothetical protein
MRARAYLVTVPLLAAVLVPLGWPRGRDGFPVSSYPMFTSRRAVLVDAVHVLAVDRAGATTPVSPDYVANGAVMQAAATVRRAIAEDGAAELCARVARQLPASARRDVRELLVATSLYDALAYYGGPPGNRPIRRTVHARCPVAQGGP